jgi:hypothetical protein
VDSAKNFHTVFGLAGRVIEFHLLLPKDLRMRLFLSTLLWTVCTSTLWSQQTSILFIGNSYTANNDLPDVFKKLSADFQRQVFVDTVINRGKNLSYHASQPETYQKIAERKWNYVVIQAHSAELAQPLSVIEANSRPAITQLIDSIRTQDSCARILFYMTWGYKNGNAKWEPIDSYTKMQDWIEKEYLRMSDIFTVPVVPVGAVWREVRRQSPQLELYHPDQRHPSMSGTYLAACTFFAYIYGVSPLNNTMRIDIPVNDKRRIELTASQTVLNNPLKWRWQPRFPEMTTGFDLILRDKELRVANNAQHYSYLTWDFGDGHVSEEESPTHTYTVPGVYSVSQMVSNACETKMLQRTFEIRK